MSHEEFPPLPQVDDHFIQQLYADMASMNVELDFDPVSHGPRHLNGKTATARRHLSRIQSYMTQISAESRNFARMLRSEKIQYDLRLKSLITEDVEILQGRSIKDREAMAENRLRMERERILELEASLQDLEMVLQVVKAKQADLRDIANRLRDQWRLCQEELGLGRKWGAAPSPTVENGIPAFATSPSRGYTPPEETVSATLQPQSEVKQALEEVAQTPFEEDAELDSFFDQVSQPTRNPQGSPDDLLHFLSET